MSLLHSVLLSVTACIFEESFEFSHADRTGDHIRASNLDLMLMHDRGFPQRPEVNISSYVSININSIES